MEHEALNEEYGRNKDDVLKRLKRIEGQIKGIQKMVEQDQQCVDILTQFAAVRAAINKAGSLVLKGYSQNCVKNAFTSENKEKAMGEMIDTIQKFLKFMD